MSTISYTLRELKEAGFIRETGMGESSFLGGKPPVRWELSPDYGLIEKIGVTLLADFDEIFYPLNKRW